MAVSKRIILGFLLLALGSVAQEVRYEPEKASPFHVPYGSSADPDLQRKVDDINLLLRKRDFAEARPALAALLEKNPQLWNAYAILNRLYQANQQYEEILALGDRLITLRPDLNAGHLMQGDALYQMTRYHEALEAYEQAQQIAPADARPIFRISQTLAVAGQVEEAVAEYHKALQKNPTRAEFLHQIGRLRRSQGEIDEAIKYFKQVLRLDPDYIPAHVRLAACFAAKGNLPQAFKHGETAIKMNPDLASTRNLMGFLYMRKGDHERARPHFEAAVKLNENHFFARRNLGIMNLQQNREDPAIQHLKAATELEPGSHFALNLLGILYMRTGQLDLAQETYEAVLDLNPGNALAYFQLASIQTSKRDMKASVKIYREGIACNPWHVQMLNNLAWIVTSNPDPEINDPAEGLALATRACNLSGWLAPGTIDTLATAHSALGNHQEAVMWGHEALLLAQRERREGLLRVIARNLEKMEIKARRAALFN